MTLRGLVTAWQNFWFKAKSPLSLCVFRIAFGLMFLTQILTQYWNDFFVFFGTHPFIPQDDFIAFWTQRAVFFNLFDFLPTQNSWHIAFFVVVAILTLMMIVGLFTRASTILVFLAYCSICHQYPFLLNAGDTMQRLGLFLLCFSRAGDALSVDAYLKSRKGDWRRALFNPPPVSPWAQRMIQMQFAIAYFSTGLLKINAPVWFNGNGCYIATRLNDFAKLPVPILFEHRVSLFFMNWLTIGAELSLSTLIWFKELRYWIILCGVLLHVGIDWMLNIPIFEFAFMSFYILFIDPEDMKKLGCWLILLSKRLYRKNLSIGLLKRDG